MVYNSDVGRTPDRLFAILVADLTTTQLGQVQEKFGIGANMCCPYAEYELFIQDKRELSARPHAELKRAFPEKQPLLVIDSRTPEDGGIWYLERFADQDDVDEELAENMNTLFKIRMDIRDVVINFVNYDIANTDISEDLDTVDISLPIPEDFDQKRLLPSCLDWIGERYLNRATIIAVPDEMEESTDSRDLDGFFPPPDVVYSLKEDIARQAGLDVTWSTAYDAPDEITLPDGTKKKFPEGSKKLNVKYNPETAVPSYERPEGSL